MPDSPTSCRKESRCYGQVNNFLNQKYEEAFGFPALRLNFMAGLKLDLPPSGKHGE